MNTSITTIDKVEVWAVPVSPFSAPLAPRPVWLPLSSLGSATASAARRPRAGDARRPWRPASRSTVATCHSNATPAREIRRICERQGIPRKQHVARENPVSGA